jgi:tetratricopeptide (TPR) repeat protein
LVPASDRLLLIPLESRGSRILVAVVTVALTAWLARGIVRPAVAEYLARRATTAVELERALAWDPGNPTLHILLGQAYETPLEAVTHEKARVHFETALRLRPTSPGPRIELALLADDQGARDRARQFLDAALRADPHNVNLRWEAALLALRWQDRDLALEHLRYVLAVDPGQRDAAFQLARTLLRPDEDPATLLPREGAGLTNVLSAAVEQGDLALAEVAWTARVKLEPAIPEPTRHQYLDRLIEAGRGAMARQVWLTLVPDRNRAAPDDAIWNGGFEAERLLGWGLDWRVRSTWGVDVILDRVVSAQGRHSLRLTFNSFPTLDFAGVSQFVPVEPGREYRLRALAKAQDFTTSSGLKLEVVSPGDDEVLAETSPISGTSADWVPLETGVRIPEGTSLVRVRLRREKAAGPEGNLGGKVWVDEVSLR